MATERIRNHKRFPRIVHFWCLKIAPEFIHAFLVTEGWRVWVLKANGDIALDEWWTINDLCLRWPPWLRQTQRLSAGPTRGALIFTFGFVTIFSPSPKYLTRHKKPWRNASIAFLYQH